jgi:ferric iron reductase protein FhuF
MKNLAIERELDRMQNELRYHLRDQTLEIREDSTIDKLIKRFRLTIEFVPAKSMLDISLHDWVAKKTRGIVMVPNDHALGQDIMRKRNVALISLMKLRKQ